MVGFVQSASPRHSTTVTAVHAAAPGVPSVPLGERSRLGAKLAAGEFITTVEIVPPKGVDPAPMFAGARPQGGGAGQRARRPARADAYGRDAPRLMVEREIGIEAVLHYCCRDRNLLGMMSDLLGAAAFGLHNLLLITGDPPKMGPYPDATAVFDIDAIGLTNMVNKLNHGLDLGNNPIGKPTAFSIGVGVNPGAVNMEEEIRRFEWKVEAGAEYAITQPVFDTEQLNGFSSGSRTSHPDRRRHLAAGVVPQRRISAQRSPGQCRTRSILDRMRKASAVGRKKVWPRGCGSPGKCWRRSGGGCRGSRSRRPWAGSPWLWRS